MDSLKEIGLRRAEAEEEIREVVERLARDTGLIIAAIAVAPQEWFDEDIGDFADGHYEVAVRLASVELG
jgi:hypothetical protein